MAVNGTNPENVLGEFNNIHEALEDFVLHSRHCPSYVKRDFEKANIMTEDDTEIEDGEKEDILEGEEGDEFDALHISPNGKLMMFIHLRLILILNNFCYHIFRLCEP